MHLRTKFGNNSFNLGYFLLLFLLSPVNTNEVSWLKRKNNSRPLTVLALAPWA
jgi:hypothetical protein